MKEIPTTRLLETLGRLPGRKWARLYGWYRAEQGLGVREAALLALRAHEESTRGKQSTPYLLVRRSEA